MELNELIPSESAELVLLHPSTRRPLDAVIILAGKDSEAAADAQRKIANRRLAASARGGPSTTTAEQLEDEATLILAEVTLGWRGILEDGKPLQFSRSAAMKVYGDPRYRWIREQVDRFIGDRANFFPDSGKDSVKQSESP